VKFHVDKSLVLLGKTLWISQNCFVDQGVARCFGWRANNLYDRHFAGGLGMGNKLWLVLALVASGATISGCVPLVVGAAGAVVVDEVIERKQGGDGLF